MMLGRTEKTEEEKFSALETGKLSKHESLKARLVAFWNSQEQGRNVGLDEAAASLPSRGRAAAYLPEGSKILDVACGTTANVEWFRRRGCYFGTDVCFGFLRLAHKPEKRLTCANAEALPFGDASFDAATLTFALEHTVNPVGVLREMCRVVGKKGRVILLGPNWDLPFWYPNALASRGQKAGWIFRYTISRLLGQLGGWIFGRLPFVIVEEPDIFVREFEIDADAVYVVWSYEVIRQMKRCGFKLIHSEVDDRLLGTNFGVRLLKRLLFLLPPYRLAGSTVLMVFERE
jgi:SAM-dependent methyltransferase